MPLSVSLIPDHVGSFRLGSLKSKVKISFIFATVSLNLVETAVFMPSIFPCTLVLIASHLSEIAVFIFPMIVEVVSLIPFQMSDAFFFMASSFPPVMAFMASYPRVYVSFSAVMAAAAAPLMPPPFSSKDFLTFAIFCDTVFPTAVKASDVFVFTASQVFFTLSLMEETTLDTLSFAALNPFVTAVLTLSTAPVTASFMPFQMFEMDVFRLSKAVFTFSTMSSVHALILSQFFTTSTTRAEIPATRATMPRVFSDRAPPMTFAADVIFGASWSAFPTPDISFPPVFNNGDMEAVIASTFKIVSVCFGVSFDMASVIRLARPTTLSRDGARAVATVAPSFAKAPPP